MNRREMKKQLRKFAIMQMWYSDSAKDDFQVLNDLRTKAALNRFEEVLMELVQEAQRDE